MGNNEIDPRRIVFFSWDKNVQPDPELMAWLESFMAQLEDEGLLPGDWRSDDEQEPSEIEQLEYLDSTVTGDHHPEALGWIMAAYDRYQNGR